MIPCFGFYKSIMSTKRLFASFNLYHPYLHFHDIVSLALCISKTYLTDIIFWQSISHLNIDNNCIRLKHQNIQCLDLICPFIQCTLKSVLLENIELSMVENFMKKLFNMNSLYMRNVSCKLSNRTSSVSNSTFNNHDQNLCIVSSESNLYDSIPKTKCDIQTCSIDFYTGSVLQLRLFILNLTQRLVSLELKNCLKINSEFLEEILPQLPLLEVLVVENSLFLTTFDLAIFSGTKMKHIAIKKCPNFTRLVCVNSLSGSGEIDNNSGEESFDGRRVDSSAAVATHSSQSNSHNAINKTDKSENNTMIQSLDLSYTNISLNSIASLFDHKSIRGSLTSLTCDHCLQLTGPLHLRLAARPGVGNHDNIPNTKLQHLSLSGCFGLTALDVDFPCLSSLTISGCLGLETLVVSSRMLCRLDISLLINLKHLDIENCSALLHKLLHNNSSPAAAAATGGYRREFHSNFSDNRDDDNSSDLDILSCRQLDVILPEKLKMHYDDVYSEMT